MVDAVERFIPDIDELRSACDNCGLACEHWHRYLYASQFVAGKTVLDIASGEGYGSAYLAETAKQVVGVDVDPGVVRHATSKYLRPNVEFRCGSAEAIPLQGSHLFDVVVSFETIEHIWSQQQLAFLREIERLLKPEGILVISTPNKQYYPEKNQFHRSEFYYDEYVSLLKKYFSTVHLVGQKTYRASYIWELTKRLQCLKEYQLTYSNGHFTPAAGDEKQLLYMLAVCSNREIEAPAGSLLLDVSEEGMRKQLDREHIREETHQREIQALAKENEAVQREAVELQREAAELQRQAQEQARDQEASQREAAELRQTIEDQQKQLSELRSRVDLMSDREKELRALLVDAHDQLLRRDEETQILLAKALQQKGPVVTGAIAASKASIQSSYLSYRLVIHQIREVVGRTLPVDATVLVVSKGDTELMKLPVKEARHFPQRDDGAYAGYYPADSAAAIEHLEALRAKGADFLLFPSTALWWLEHYAEFRQHLEDRYEKVVDQKGAGVIFALHGPARSEQKRQYQELLHRVREVVRDTLPPDATVLVVSKGDEELLRLDGRRGWHFPQQEDGAYAGHNPADSAAAIEHLEALRAKGADFLLFPSTAFWWLEHYAEFRQHLESRYQRERSDEGCVIYRINRDGIPAVASGGSASACVPGQV